MHSIKYIARNTNFERNLNIIRKNKEDIRKKKPNLYTSIPAVFSGVMEKLNKESLMAFKMINIRNKYLAFLLTLVSSNLL